MTDLIDMRGVPFQMDANRNAARPDDEYRSAWKAYLAPVQSRTWQGGEAVHPPVGPLGTLIYNRRIALGISRNRLDILIGVQHRGYIHTLETGRIDFPKSYLRKISEVLDIPLPDLLAAAFEGMDNEQEAAA